jgi:hypothetical protein
MSYYYKYRTKTKNTGLNFDHQKNFVRQALEAKRDGKRISVRLPQILDKYISKDLSNLVVRLLAEEFSKQRSAYEDYTQEQLMADLEGI